MIMPGLREIFDHFEFTYHISPDLHHAQHLFSLSINKLPLDYKTKDDIETHVNDMLSESQYLGFVQGFEFARSLFGGKFI